MNTKSHKCLALSSFQLRLGKIFIGVWQRYKKILVKSLGVCSDIYKCSGLCRFSSVESMVSVGKVQYWKKQFKFCELVQILSSVGDWTEFWLLIYVNFSGLLFGDKNKFADKKNFVLMANFDIYILSSVKSYGTYDCTVDYRDMTDFLYKINRYCFW